VMSMAPIHATATTCISHSIMDIPSDRSGAWRTGPDQESVVDTLNPASGTATGSCLELFPRAWLAPGRRCVGCA